MLSKGSAKVMNTQNSPQQDKRRREESSQLQGKAPWKKIKMDAFPTHYHLKEITRCVLHPLSVTYCPLSCSRLGRITDLTHCSPQTAKRRIVLSSSLSPSHLSVSLLSFSYNQKLIRPNFPECHSENS